MIGSFKRFRDPDWISVSIKGKTNSYVAITSSYVDSDGSLKSWQDEGVSIAVEDLDKIIDLLQQAKIETQGE